MACVGRDKDKKWQLAFLGRQIQKLEKRISHCQSPTLINPNQLHDFPSPNHMAITCSCCSMTKPLLSTSSFLVQREQFLTSFVGHHLTSFHHCAMPLILGVTLKFQDWQTCRVQNFDVVYSLSFIFQIQSVLVMENLQNIVTESQSTDVT